MELLSAIMNPDGSIDWWTSTQAAETFWSAFGGALLGGWAAYAARHRPAGRQRHVR